jgi:hypothetical protein
LHPALCVVNRPVPGHPYSLDDGLGIRRVESDGRMYTEILELPPLLAARPAMEEAIHGRASRYADLDIRTFAPVRRIERTGISLHVVSEMPPGVRLSDVLAHLQATGHVARESAMLELASLVVNAVAALHSWPGGIAHGAITPAHVLMTTDARVMLTDCVFGAGIELLQRNRDMLWNEFRLAMPASASLAKFDQQADVTQMGAVVLAIVLQRQVRAEEYPHALSDLVVRATEAAKVPGGADAASALRSWLQQTLQVHPRLAFRSAVDAQRAFAEIVSRPAHRRAGPLALQELLRTICGEPFGRPQPALNPLAQATGAFDAHRGAPGARSHDPFESIMRAVFDKH